MAQSETRPSKWNEENVGEVKSTEFMRCSLYCVEEADRITIDKLKINFFKKAAIYATLALAAATREHTEAVS